ncbi:MAG: methyl-accepting chemotaxis protein [Proteobacteria bacterium]|nr:methyl-accepting chemotaxis protein [Pseudomonadota bacterium]
MEEKSASIRKSLAKTVVFTTLVALVVVSGAFVTLELSRYRTRAVAAVSVLGDVIGMNSSAALLFDDTAPAEEALLALAVEPHVMAAIIFREDGSEFARFEREQYAGQVEVQAKEAGHEWTSNWLDVHRDITIDGEVLGSIFVRTDTQQWKELILGYVGIVAVVMIFAAGIALVASSWLRGKISNPLAELVDGAESLAKGDLSVSVTLQNQDEIGTLGGAFNAMAVSLRELVSRVQQDGQEVRTVAADLEESGQSLSSQVKRQEQATDATAQSIDRMRESVVEVSSNVESLADTANEASSSVVEMDASISEIAMHMDHLSQTIDGAASSVVQMTAAIGEITRNSNTLGERTDETANSLRTLRTSVEQVANNAEQSHEFSEKTREEAERGMSSVNETITGMQEIQVSFRGLESIVSRLAERSQSIGEVVKVIEGVVTQTNLLALNASIIASHAGEHGRAFSVVAKEVQNLADTTASSTREIEAMIKSVQRDMSAAVEAVAAGSECVERGTSLSTVAGDVLQTIAESSRKSSAMVNEIVMAAGGQARDIGELDGSMVQVKDMVGQIVSATREQNSASEDITRGVERMRELGQEVKRSTREQTKQSRIITATVEEVAQRMQQIASATAEQKQGGEQISGALQVFREVTDESGRRADVIRQTVENLSNRSRALEQEIGRFKL